jgi:ketosteroid isomerase-like protein
MSQENVEFIRQSIRRYFEGDIERLREDYTADAVVHAPTGWPDGARFEGREAVIRQFARLREDWQWQELDAAPRLVSRGDYVIAEMRWSAVGAGSGVPIDSPVIVGAYRVHRGRIREVRFFWDWAEALEAAGLSE